MILAISAYTWVILLIHSENVDYTNHTPCLLLWLWSWTYFNPDWCSPTSNQFSKNSTSTTLLENQSHLQSTLGEFYCYHSTLYCSQTSEMFSLSIWYSPLFLLFSESQLHPYQVRSIYFCLSLNSLISIIKTFFNNSSGCLLQWPGQWVLMLYLRIKSCSRSYYYFATPSTLLRMK